MNVKNISGGAEKRMILRRVLIYGCAAFLLGVLQCSFFSRLKPFGATPDLILGSLCAIALLDNKKSAVVYAIGAGYFIDALGSVSPSFGALFYLVCAVIAVTVAEKIIPQFFSFAILLLPMLVCRALYTYLSLWLSLGSLPPIGASMGLILPEMLSTFVVCLPVYFVIKLCTIPIGARSRFSF